MGDSTTAPSKLVRQSRHVSNSPFWIISSEAAANQALTATSNVAIRSVASGQRAAYLQAGGVRAGAETEQDDGKQAKQGKRGKEVPRGITVAGELKNYLPVTDAMLRNPDPDDWLMIRHDYKANTCRVIVPPPRRLQSQRAAGRPAALATRVALAHPSGWCKKHGRLPLHHNDPDTNDIFMTAETAKMLTAVQQKFTN